MSKRFRPLISAIAAVVAIVALATPARADLEIWASTTDNPPTSGDVVATQGGSNPVISGINTTVGVFAITALGASSNSSGTMTLGQENGTTTEIINNGSATATLYITVGSTGFTQPVTPPPILLDSSIGGTVTLGSTANTLTYQSWVDPANGQNTTTGFTDGAQTPTDTVQGSSFNNSATPTTITSLAATYSITEYFAITLGAGAEINFSSSTLLVSTTPEPSTLAIAGLGALGFVGYGLRRRLKK